MKSKIATNRIVFIGLVFGLLAAGIIVRVFYLVFDENDYYNDLVEERVIRTAIVEPSRGNIYGEDGSLLVSTVVRYSIHWDSKVVSEAVFERNKEALADSLASLLGKGRKVWLQKIEKAKKRGARYETIATKINYNELTRLKTFPIFKLSTYRGGMIQESHKQRYNLLGEVAKRTIGKDVRVSDNVSTRIGLEGFFSHSLRGEEGRRLEQQIGKSQYRPLFSVNERKPIDGKDMYISINPLMQMKVHSILEKQLKKYEADFGVAIVMEVATGRIKAISNLTKTLPTGNYTERLNHAVGFLYEPGSTFKTMALMAALESNKVEPNTLINTGNGKLKYFDNYVIDTKIGGYGWIPVSKVLEYSSNVGMVEIITKSYRNNSKQFVDRLYNMGLADKVGVSIPGEPKPYIPHPDIKNRWDKLTLPWMSFGYGVELTPLQVLTFYNGIANNGVVVKPRFVDGIGKKLEEMDRVFDVEILNPSLCSSATLKQVQKMLFNVVNSKKGTAHNIDIPGLNISGKTGTSQVDYAISKNSKKKFGYISSFVGYFPSEAPQYSCIVVIHKPKKNRGYYGGEVAGPVFKEIAIDMYNLQPNEVIVEDVQLSVNQHEGNDNFEVKKIPSLYNMVGMDAVTLLENNGVEVSLVGKGKVVKQSIPAGTPIGKVKKIKLYLL